MIQSRKHNTVKETYYSQGNIIQSRKHTTVKRNIIQSRKHTTVKRNIIQSRKHNIDKEAAYQKSRNQIQSVHSQGNLIQSKKSYTVEETHTVKESEPGSFLRLF